jgi:glutamate dehydrogenase
MRAILAAPVDLLWNGGIGTYVKASTETTPTWATRPTTHPGRRCGTAVQGRRRGRQPGLTQLGRIEYSMAGGRVNTDAIDNSAGVDCSDHEVNIKVLLDRVAQDGDLTEKQRNELLVAMTDEVASPRAA